MESVVRPSAEVVEEFVIAAHGDFPKVKEMLEKEPALLNEKWTPFDEDGLQASGHMGNREIAEFFLSKGAPLTMFAAAMLGRKGDVDAFSRRTPVWRVRTVCTAILSCTTRR